MTEATSAQGGERSLTLSRLSDLGTMLRRSDIALALGMMAILVILILPLPALLLDFSLAISITFSVLILMTSLFIQAPLEFSAFPTVLLIDHHAPAGAQLASTRLILAARPRRNRRSRARHRRRSAISSWAATYVVGMIVFLILVIVNFVVITKGAGRIAEVAARFTLDAMPGKQMAIDADLNAGLINEKEARQRRADHRARGRLLRRHGRRQQVRPRRRHRRRHHRRLINIIGGMVIGVLQQGMSVAEARCRPTPC